MTLPPEAEQFETNRSIRHRLVAYALVSVLMAIVIVVILLAYGNQIGMVFTNIVTTLR